MTPLRRRDYVILPLLSLATILLLFSASEAGARMLWPRQDKDNCLIKSSVGPRYRPNCSSSLKDPETAWATFRYNECGYRTTAHCGPKPPGTLRIFLLGSSTTNGSFMKYDETFATRMGDSVGRDLKRPVEIENFAAPLVSPLDCYRRLTEAMSLSPDVVIFSFSPDDLLPRLTPDQMTQRDKPRGPSPRTAVDSRVPALQSIHQLLAKESTSVVMAQHYLFQNTDTCIRSYLASGEKVDYLRQPFTPAWNSRFASLQMLVDDMAARLRAQGIPLILVSIPSRVQVALLRAQYREGHVDAFALGRKVQETAEEAGATYVDLMYPFSRYARPEDLFFVVNLHPTSEGHAVIARQLTPVVERLLESRIGGSRTKG